MKIGIICYASVGGSGIVATELARALADRGHEIHLFSSETPFRLRRDSARVEFHAVETPAYPLFREPQYLLSLSTKLVQVSRERTLDIVHAHYAVPHAAAAYLARQILAIEGHSRPPRVVTTLHGTDITLVGSDPSYADTVAFCIDQSDAVTAVSASLRDETVRVLGVRRPIAVIPNFLDCEAYRRRPDPALRARYCPPDCQALVIHVSNFRPVKRIDAVIEIFRRIAHEVPAKLLLVGEGPDVVFAEHRVRETGLGDRVELVGEQTDLVRLLSVADLFLLPSAAESFGLAALEAMACEVPVVASRVGGLPEVIEHGTSGVLHPPDHLDAMARSGIELLADRARHERIAAAARRAVVERFCVEKVVPQYERLYQELLQERPQGPTGRSPV